MTEKTDTSSPSGEHLVTIREALNLLHIGHQNERLPQEAPCPYCDRRAAGLAALTEVEQQLETLRADTERIHIYELEKNEARERAEAAETALAEANALNEHTTYLMERAEAARYAAEVNKEAAERRANDQQARADDLEIRMDAEIVAHGETEQQRDALADALREIAHEARTPRSDQFVGSVGKCGQIARAALDQQEQP
jgi:hypothetical protein